MLKLHLTRELAKAVKLPAKWVAQPEEHSSVLGPWSLGLAHSRPAKLVVAVSVPTRWSFALHAAPLATLGKRFGPALLLNLLALGVPPDRARAEVDAHAPWQWALGHDRGALAHLNQCVEDVQWAADEGMSLPSINQRLAERIILRPRTCVPGEEVLDLLGGDSGHVLHAKHTLVQDASEMRAFMQAQAGKSVVTLPVLRLLGRERLEARHQATILLMHLPKDERRRLPTGLPPRWVPHDLVLDLEGIEAVTPQFAAMLRAEVGALGLPCLQLANASDEVASQMLQNM